ncbi:MAG: GatB/YqeY domain-containing protein [Candidatus Fonsibacter sp.]|nr:GatB/YqeY domain-containing protein [Candidatus Fonsibacter sp.]
MNLLDKINTQLKESALKQDKDKLLTLRLIISALKDKEIEKRGVGVKDTSIKDEDVIVVLNKMLKQRRESLEIYKKALRNDLAEKENKEINIIQEFLPKQLDDNETKKACEGAIKFSGATSIKDMGKAMANLKSKYSGSIDFSKAGALLKELLSK